MHSAVAVNSTIQKVMTPKGDKAEVVKTGTTLAKKKAQENTVIKIIQKEWDKELERLDAKKSGTKKAGDKSLV